MGQGRLSNLALLSIEKEEFEHINVDNVIDKFLNVKPGRMSRLYELENSSYLDFFQFTHCQCIVLVDHWWWCLGALGRGLAPSWATTSARHCQYILAN